jgi:hypothetical protein
MWKVQGADASKSWVGRAEPLRDNSIAQRAGVSEVPDDPLSTARREPGIFVHVHPVLLRIAEAS